MENIRKNAIMSHIRVNKDTEYDWSIDFGVYALNLSTMQFENTSYITKNALIVINIYNNMADFSEDIAEEAKSNNATFILYSENHFVVGYVKEP